MVKVVLVLRKSWRSVLIPIVLVGVGLPVLIAQEAIGSPPPEILARYNRNINGDFLLVGNTVLKCGSSPDACASPSTNNDVLEMINKDPDGAGARFNGSSGSFTIPTGSVVDAAFLYWGANLGALGTLDNGATAAVCSADHAAGVDRSTADKALAGTVRVSIDNGAYATVNATTSHTSPAGGSAKRSPPELESTVWSTRAWPT